MWKRAQVFLQIAGYHDTETSTFFDTARKIAGTEELLKSIVGNSPSIDPGSIPFAFTPMTRQNHLAINSSARQRPVPPLEKDRRKFALASIGISILFSI
jgi:hypothetical protein